jgi:hypothetical protein
MAAAAITWRISAAAIIITIATMVAATFAIMAAAVAAVRAGSGRTAPTTMCGFAATTTTIKSVDRCQERGPLRPLSPLSSLMPSSQRGAVMVFTIEASNAPLAGGGMRRRTMRAEISVTALRDFGLV